MNQAAIARYARAMELAPMPDMTHAQARQLIKAGSSQVAERKRGVPNVFSTVSGASQPRQGFLST